MTRTDGHRAVYLWRAYLLALIGTLLVAVLAVLVFPQPETDPAPPPPLFGGGVVHAAAPTHIIAASAPATARVRHVPIVAPCLRAVGPHAASWQLFT